MLVHGSLVVIWINRFLYQLVRSFFIIWDATYLKFQSEHIFHFLICTKKKKKLTVHFITVKIFLLLLFITHHHFNVVCNLLFELSALLSENILCEKKKKINEEVAIIIKNRTINKQQIYRQTCERHLRKTSTRVFH